MYKFSDPSYVVEFMEVPSMEAVYGQFDAIPRLSKDVDIIEDEHGRIEIDCDGNIELAFLVRDWFEENEPLSEPFVAEHRLVDEVPTEENLTK